METVVGVWIKHYGDYGLEMYEYKTHELIKCCNKNTQLATFIKITKLGLYAINKPVKTVCCRIQIRITNTGTYLKI